MKVGTKLKGVVSIDHYGLIKGAEYEVVGVSSWFFKVLDEFGVSRIFLTQQFETYFQSITPESLEELGFEKDKIVDVWWIKVSDMYSMTADSKGVYLNGHRVPKCHNLTDLKHLIRILGV